MPKPTPTDPWVAAAHGERQRYAHSMMKGRCRSCGPNMERLSNSIFYKVVADSVVACLKLAPDLSSDSLLCALVVVCEMRSPRGHPLMAHEALSCLASPFGCAELVVGRAGSQKIGRLKLLHGAHRHPCTGDALRHPLQSAQCHQ